MEVFGIGAVVTAFFGNIISPLLEGIFGPFLPTIKTIFTVIIIICLAGLIYIFIRWREIQDIEYLKYKAIETSELETKERNVEWYRVQQHIESEYPAEWRMAILSADTILDTVLREHGYEGESVGARLQSVDPTDLRSLSFAWEAHKMRNRIAHEGAHFEMSKREARRIIALYEKVFIDLKYL